MIISFIIIAILSVAGRLIFLKSEHSQSALVQNTQGATTTSLPEASDKSAWPIANPFSRVTAKPFGIWISPASSPVQPERFSGYHTGIDFEIFSHEQDAEVAVYAICPGPLVSKRMASGYGGVAVQRCILGGETVTVVYGHLRLESIGGAVGEELSAGEYLGSLGDGYSEETDEERKHLHLAIRRGEMIDLRGYVSRREELSGWMDPMLFISEE